MEIIQVISEHKRIRGKRGENGRFIPPIYPGKGYKRVEAIIKSGGRMYTSHMDILK